MRPSLQEETKGRGWGPSAYLTSVQGLQLTNLGNDDFLCFVFFSQGVSSTGQSL